jgi:hypothetical protein
MNFTILIGTCDKYSFLWKNFTTLFKKYWDHNIKVDKYFLSETITADIEGFNTFTPGVVPYSDCIKYALDRISTPYVLWMQDDYFLRKMITIEQFNQYFEYIEKYNVDRFTPNRYTPHTVHYTFDGKIDNYPRMSQNSNYTISMQASIWNKNFLQKCLIQQGTENPWQFEVDGSTRLNNTSQHCILYELSHDQWYQEAMRKGTFTKEYYDIIKLENL